MMRLLYTILHFMQELMSSHCRVMQLSNGFSPVLSDPGVSIQESFRLPTAFIYYIKVQDCFIVFMFLYSLSMLKVPIIQITLILGELFIQLSPLIAVL
jgi:hypothetical protein